MVFFDDYESYVKGLFLFGEENEKNTVFKNANSFPRPHKFAVAQNSVMCILRPPDFLETSTPPYGRT